jgi:hypothetical protein
VQYSDFETGDPMPIPRRRIVTSLAAALCANLIADSSAEPITLGVAAAFVGIALLQGAISYVGGVLMAKALGTARIEDVKEWIGEAVSELEAFVSAEVRRQLDEKVLQKLRSDLQGVITNLDHYARLGEAEQRDNKYLISTSDTTTSSLIALSLNYDQAIFISTATMAYRLFILQALYKLDRAPGHIESAKPMTGW